MMYSDSLVWRYNVDIDKCGRQIDTVSDHGQLELFSQHNMSPRNTHFVVVTPIVWKSMEN